MTKLTKTQLKRNNMYAKVAETDFGDFEVKGHVKQGLVLRNDETGQDVVIKAIFKKSQVDLEADGIERPTEQPKDEDKDKEAKAEDDTDKETKVEDDDNDEEVKAEDDDKEIKVDEDNDEIKVDDEDNDEPETPVDVDGYADIDNRGNSEDNIGEGA